MSDIACYQELGSEEHCISLQTDQCCYAFTFMKQGLGSVLKALAGIAGLVFLMAPLTDMGVLVSMVALVVAIIAGVTGVHLSDDEGSDNNSGFWPKDPRSGQ